MLLNGHPGGFVFFSGGLPEKGAQFFFEGREVGCDLHRKCSTVVNLLSFLYNYDNLTLELKGKRSYLDEGWIFSGRFKVGSVPGIGFALKVSKKYQNPS